MKAPDKIYIPKEEVESRKTWIEQPYEDDPNWDECYIRKDALLEYFHSRVEELNSPLNGVFGSTEREHCNERISELLLLVDKLNSL